MAEAADHSSVKSQYPVVAQSLSQAASQQLRNMASLGGNVLQRTRCTYFRDVSYSECNKRNPGSRCAALTGFNRMHAVLGASDQCIATYPGDFAQALIALEATVEIAGSSSSRNHPVCQPPPETGRHAGSGNQFTAGRDHHIVSDPCGAMDPAFGLSKSVDRQSYEFALASAAVALDQQNGIVRTARIALGGLATVPWRAIEAEALLRGKSVNEQHAAAAASAAFAGANGSGYNDFKIELGKRTLIRALQQAAALEI
jgi:xanthine dehydrogenase YagS FAD-binding subunit